MRNGAYKRLGFNPTQGEEETEEEAQQAGVQMREHVRQMVAPLPDLPDRYDPEEAAGPSRRRDNPARPENTTKPKYRRVQFSNDVE